MLVELALRGRLQLEACGVRRKSLLSRKVRSMLMCSRLPGEKKSERLVLGPPQNSNASSAKCCNCVWKDAFLLKSVLLLLLFPFDTAQSHNHITSESFTICTVIDSICL